MLYLAIFICVFILITIIYFLNTEIVVEYVRNGWDDHALISFSPFRGVKFKYEVSLMGIRNSGFKMKRVKKKSKKQNNEEVEQRKASKDVKHDDRIGKGIEDIFGRIDYFKNKYDKLNFFINYAIKKLKSKIKLKKFNVEMTIGTGDASLTGIMTGVAWMVTGIIYSNLSMAFPIHNKHIKINSDFSKTVFDANILCIFNIRMGHIIKVVFLLILKLLEGGGLFGRTSNTRSYEYCNEQH
ncbi:DUF2953 domain-containing protein [Pseudobacteroides cellulosolvens]|uniref:DUF2953 domain-containing protein n=1 Tax=Pseudobacteroides cellulosolvens ATCC 35603 = DSM 2933 TaxID=398512 RepID=A0A0L6JHU7_9FIRM|nr:DUF2953 domain-containing protein [Pseudobacteroides cellulosolvens]KNY25057.1 Protein of unknown function DUF2953 [Pseudobacteroides cellulosolvens ATCC 35603 = DSM 2933]